MYDNTSRVIDVDIEEILPSRFQPRLQFDEEEILQLSDSIKEHGVIQPIVVRKIGDKYEIIAGERRYKASVLAGKETVPVIVKELNDKDSAEIAIIENVQRKNLTPIEEALSYKKILDMGYITQENLANKLGKSQPSVANKIRLLNLSDEVQEALLENKISERHARSLLRLKTSKEQNEMLNRIVSERLTVRRTDEEIEKLKQTGESDDGSQKEIERGNINMNNNQFGIPSVPTQQPTTFDIFGAGNPVQPQNISQPTEQPTMPQMETVAMPEPMPQFQPFETVQPAPAPQPQFENMAIPSVGQSMQSQPATPEPELHPTEQPTMPQIQTIEQPSPVQSPEIQIDNMTIPSVEPMPEIQPATPEPAFAPSFNATPTIDSMPFITQSASEATNNEAPQPEQSLNQDQPVNFEVPQTSPIIESQPQMSQPADNLFAFGTQQDLAPQEPVQPAPAPQPEVAPAEESTIPEFRMPEPIIVTDYNKQYDPVMPQPEQPQIPKVEFKEVINAIRECSNKIEQYGFKVDIEEYDLANLYQVVFKVEK